jgi:hypothetical protein
MFSTCKRHLDNCFHDKRITMVVLCIWFIIVSVLFFYLGLFSTEYMAVGPGPRLKYMGLHLDTWERYNAVLVFVIISTAINDFAGDAIGPWIQNCICDFKTRSIPYSKTTCLMITQTWSAYCGIMGILSISLVFSQFDLLAVRLIVDLIVSQYTTMRFLRNKTHSAEEYNRFFENTGEDDVELGIDVNFEEHLHNMHRLDAHKKNTEIVTVHESVPTTVLDEKQSLLNVVESSQ